jgi:DNA polymerase sigma
MFGSSYTGTAIASSDIDIVILKAPLDYTQV